MKRVILSALVFGMLTTGAVYAQNGTHKSNKPATEKSMKNADKKDNGKTKTKPVTKTSKKSGSKKTGKQ